jgi:16S rRNA processing protein RimM
MANEAVHADGRRVCLGVITGARGLRGDVWVKSFTADPADVGSYGPLSDAAGERTFRLRVVEPGGDRVLARIDGIADRTAAERLKGTELYVSRAALPPAGDDEFYYTDLIGLAARILAPDGVVQDEGVVRAVHDFGGGSVLEVDAPVLGSLLVPFTRAAVPEVDVAGGRVVVALLPGLLPASNDDGETPDDPERA